MKTKPTIQDYLQDLQQACDKTLSNMKIEDVNERGCLFQYTLSNHKKLGLLERPKKPNAPKQASAEAHYKYAEELEKYEKEYEEYCDYLKNLRICEGKITQKFKTLVLEEIGVSNHPKADSLWALAWEYGHSSGYSEVYYYATELSELIL